MTNKKNSPGSVSLAVFLAAAILSGCAGGPKMGNKLQVFDLTDQRVSDLTIVKKVIGKSDFLFFSKTRIGTFLEGYIQGTVTDYNENPIEGVVVRAVPEGSGAKRNQASETEEAEAETPRVFESSSFDAGISDSNGLFRIRFSLPLIDRKVDMRGRLIFNPGWEQQKANLGRTYEPQTKETPFRLYYDANSGLLAFGEGIRKSVVQPLGGGTDLKARAQALPGASAPLPVKPAETASQKKEKSTQAEDDIFKGFNFGQ